MNTVFCLINIMRGIMLKLKKIFDSTYMFFSCVIIAILTFIVFKYRNFIILDSQEASIINKNGIKFFLAFLAIYIFLAYLKKILNHISERTLTILFLVFYFLFGLYLIFNVDGILRYDQLYVYESALAMNKGNYSSLMIDGYIGKYIHQLGIVTLERLLLFISTDIHFLYFVNLISVCITDLCLIKICNKFIKKALSRKYAIVFIFLFIQQLFYILFVYNVVIGLMFLTISLYYFLRYLETNKKTDFIIFNILLVIACILRSNFLIAMISCSLILLNVFFKTKRMKEIILIVILFCSYSFIQNGMKKIYEERSGIALDAGIPKIAWIAMGLQDCEKSSRPGGWYNGFIEEVYLDFNYDVDALSAYSLTAIEWEMSDFMQSPTKAFQFFSNKIITSWTDPLFQSIWSGPLENENQYTYTNFLKNIYSGGIIYRIIALIENVFVAIIYLCSFIRLINIVQRKEEMNNYERFAYLLLVGGFIFHLFWETKSQYVYFYVIFLIPIAANCFSNMSIKQWF